MSENVRFDDCDKEFQECFLNNYGACDCSKSKLVVNHLEFEVTEQEFYEMLKIIEDRLHDNIGQ